MYTQLFNYFEVALVAFAVALVAFVYSQILTAPGMVLNPLYNWLAELLTNEHHSQRAKLLAPQVYKPGLYAPWLFKPLIGCYKCVAGQLALWYYFYAYSQAYSLPQHVFFICFAIFLSIAISKIHTWLTQ